MSGEEETRREIAPPFSAVQLENEEAEERTSFDAVFSLARIAAPLPLPSVFLMLLTITSMSASTPSSISISDTSVCACVPSVSDSIVIDANLNVPFSTLNTFDVSVPDSTGRIKEIDSTSTVSDPEWIVKIGRSNPIDSTFFFVFVSPDIFSS